LEELRQKLRNAEDVVSSLKSKIGNTEKKLKNQQSYRKISKDLPKDKHARILELEALLEKEKAEKATILADWKREKV